MTTSDSPKTLPGAVPAPAVEIKPAQCKNPEFESRALKIAIDILNEFQKADPAGCTSIMQHHVETTEAIANHKTIVCQPAKRGDKHEVGFLGLLNGMLEPITGKRIAKKVTEAGQIVGFVEYTP